MQAAVWNENPKPREQNSAMNSLNKRALNNGMLLWHEPVLSHLLHY